MRDTVESGGGKFAIVFWPRADYVEGDVETGMSAWLTARFEEFGRDNAIPTFFLQGTFRPYPKDRLNIPRDGHPTPLAHCLVARDLTGLFETFGYPVKAPVHCAAPTVAASQH